MVKVSYCTNCQKAYRFHLKKKFICTECKETMETIDVPRSKYFLVQIPLLISGFVIICYSIFKMYIDPKRLAEPFGLFIFGFSLELFALAFQMMDNKTMELMGKDVGQRQFAIKGQEERVSRDKIKTMKKPQEKIFISKTLTNEKTKTPVEDLFIQPNRPRTTIKKPKKKPSDQPVTVSELKKIAKTKPKEKKARKIRRAI